MAENGNGARALGRVALQLLGPAVLAALGGYVGVYVGLVRVEEKIDGVRLEMRLRDRYVRDDLKSLRDADLALATRIEALQVR